MFVLLHFGVGIIVMHVAWLLFYLTGTVIWTPAILNSTERRSPAGRSALLEVVIVTAAGMAIVGFTSFVLGMFALLYPVTGLVALAVLLATFVLLGDVPFARPFWALRFERFRRAITPWSAGLYAICLTVALPAVLPATAFDPLFYHFTYALDWATNHRIYVDEWLRFPYYANNWLLLETWIFTFGRAADIQFLGWFGGMLSILGVFGLVEALAERSRSSQLAIRLAALFAACSLLFAPVFLRWIDAGMNDSPIGFFYFAAIASVTMALATRERRWAYYAIVCFAFFVGMKSVFLAILPAAAIGVWIAMRATGASLRSCGAAVVLVVALSLPWYVKNVIAIGDPVPPLMSVFLHRPDPNWSAADIAGVAADIRGNQSPLFLLELPVNVLLHPDTLDFREPGVSLLLVLLFAPGITLIYGMIRRPTAPSTPWLTLSAYVCYAILFWLITSHLARYALLFYPSLAAFAGLGALQLAHGSRMRTAAALAALAALALPAPAGAAFLSFIWQVDYVHVGEVYTNSQKYLMANLTAYPEEEYVSRRLVRAGIPDPRVYIMGDDTLDFYFKRHGVTKIGDWFNRGRYSDFVAAIDRGTAPQFLTGLGADAFVMSVHPLLTPVRVVRLSDELVRAGFQKKALANSDTAVFFAPALAY